MVFPEECERLKSEFSKLKYPRHLIDSTVKIFINLKVAAQSSLWSKSTTENTTQVVMPFKVQDSANSVKRSQCEAPDYCPTSVYELQYCPGVPDKLAKASTR